MSSVPGSCSLLTSRLALKKIISVLSSILRILCSCCSCYFQSQRNLDMEVDWKPYLSFSVPCYETDDANSMIFFFNLHYANWREEHYCCVWALALIVWNLQSLEKAKTANRKFTVTLKTVLRSWKLQMKGIWLLLLLSILVQMCSKNCQQGS